MGAEARYSARKHALGEWMALLDTQLRAAWTYPAELRALGVVGTVVVHFKVRRDGTVKELSVVSSSHVPDLDLTALASIPMLVAAIPATVPGAARYISITFRYGDTPRAR